MIVASRRFFNLIGLQSTCTCTRTYLDLQYLPPSEDFFNIVLDLSEVQQFKIPIVKVHLRHRLQNYDFVLLMRLALVTINSWRFRLDAFTVCWSDIHIS